MRILQWKDTHSALQLASDLVVKKSSIVAVQRHLAGFEIATARRIMSKCVSLRLREDGIGEGAEEAGSLESAAELDTEPRD